VCDDNLVAGAMRFFAKGRLPVLPA